LTWTERAREHEKARRRGEEERAREWDRGGEEAIASLSILPNT
jgi:hypothetical protein